MQQINMKAKEETNMARNAFGKYVHLKFQKAFHSCLINFIANRLVG